MWKPEQNWEHESLAISLPRHSQLIIVHMHHKLNFYVESVFKMYLQTNDHVKFTMEIRVDWRIFGNNYCAFCSLLWVQIGGENRGTVIKFYHIRSLYIIVTQG